jgi:hypothetical protein
MLRVIVPVVRAPFAVAIMLGMSAEPSEAVISQEERTACDEGFGLCLARCKDTAKECGKPNTKNYYTCVEDCKSKCDLKRRDCLDDADKSAPKAPPTKVQPKVNPGGAEQPQAETPNVQPKGGIQQSP